MRKRWIYAGLATVIAIGVSVLFMQKETLLQKNVEAMADGPVKLPCSLEEGGCTFDVVSAEGEEGKMEINSMKNAK